MARNRRWMSWLIPAAILAVVFLGAGVALDAYQSRARVTEFSDRFQLLSALRRDALREYVDTVRAEITFWSLNDDLLAQQRDLARQWTVLEQHADDPGEFLRGLYVEGNPHPQDQRRELCDAEDGSKYSALHGRLHPLARLFVVERGYYDFFLIDPYGNVLYSVEKESDFGTNLVRGPWNSTGLAYVFRHALADAGGGIVAFSDFTRYPPSDDAPAMFAAKAMRDPDGNVVGVLAMQLPTDRIQDIMHFTAGMGQTGETYLVGENLLMRSDSRFAEESTILRTRVDTETVGRALGGESGVAFTDDYRGVRVLSAFTFVDIDHIRWAVMAEIDEQEVANAAGNRRSLFSGLLAMMYALALSSAWFVQSGAWGGGGPGLAPFDADFADLSD